MSINDRQPNQINVIILRLDHGYNSPYLSYCNHFFHHVSDLLPLIGQVQKLKVEHLDRMTSNITKGVLVNVMNVAIDIT